jgi:signal transduction histidine kinase
MANPFGIERYLLVPMRVGTALVGLLSVDYGPDYTPASPDDAVLMEGVAGLAALVLERERLQREREEARGSALALQEANRRMDEFLGVAGHEMRTPLTSIKVSLQLAQRRTARLREHEDAQTRGTAPGLIEVGSLLDRAAAQMRRIERLVDDMVDVSRIGAGRLEIRRQRCDLAAIVRNSVDEQRLSAPDRQIVLTGADTAVPIDADPDRIAQVVTNYLTNALKYAYGERPIQVGLASDVDAARVWVGDEGPGLTAEEGERVWEVFYRVAGVEHRHGSSVGLGMGLHICRTIVEQHGGRVGVESVPSVGATFWFTLPLIS